VLASGYTLVPEATRKRYLLLVSIPGIAIFAYLLLTLGVGQLDGGGHTVYAVRYVDWLLAIFFSRLTGDEYGGKYDGPAQWMPIASICSW